MLIDKDIMTFEDFVDYWCTFGFYTLEIPNDTLAFSNIFNIR